MNSFLSWNHDHAVLLFSRRIRFQQALKLTLYFAYVLGRLAGREEMRLVGRSGGETFHYVRDYETEILVVNLVLLRGRKEERDRIT